MEIIVLILTIAQIVISGGSTMASIYADLTNAGLDTRLINIIKQGVSAVTRDQGIVNQISNANQSRIQSLANTFMDNPEFVHLKQFYKDKLQKIESDFQTKNSNIENSINALQNEAQTITNKRATFGTKIADMFTGFKGEKQQQARLDAIHDEIRNKEQEKEKLVEDYKTNSNDALDQNIYGGTK